MYSLHYIVAMLLIALGIYCILSKRNLIKIIIGLGVITNGIHLFLISLGYRTGGGPPILSGELLAQLGIVEYASQAVDPIPQALVLTSIVIDFAITALALSLVIYIYRKYKTINTRDIKGLRE